MAKDLNEVKVLGRLGGAVELRYTAAGMAVANFSVATNNRYTTAAGDKRDDVSWHRIVVWGKLADVCAKYLHKGSRVYVAARLQYRKYTTEVEGAGAVERQSCELVADEIIFLDAAPGGNASDADVELDAAPYTGGRRNGAVPV